MTEKLKRLSKEFCRTDGVRLIALPFLLGACATVSTEASRPTVPASSPPPSESALPHTAVDYAMPDLSPAPVKSHERKDAGITVDLSPKEAPDGGMVFVKISLDAAKYPSVKDGDVRVFFEKTKYPAFFLSPNQYGAFVALPFNSAPRRTHIDVEVGAETKEEFTYEVLDGKYRNEILSVDPKFSSPPKSAAKRIAAEMKEVAKVYRQTTTEKMWQGKFALPIESPMTSPFGNKRVFNGDLKSFHQGLDLRAKTGTEIHAPEAGKVALAKNLYFSGNCVLLDHGHGLYTMYAHMSQLRVKVGQVLKKGDLIGLSGATGRVSGPHLHWGAILLGAKVNPLDLAKIIP